MNLDSVQNELDRTTSELARTKRDFEKEKVNANNSSLLSSPTPTSPSQFTSQSPAPIPMLTLGNRLTLDEVLAKNDCPALKRELRRILFSGWLVFIKILFLCTFDGYRNAVS